MNTLSKELSERLYKVSNWKDTEWWFFEDKPVYIQIEKVIADLKLTIPAYTAGYLLRRLTAGVELLKIGGLTDHYMAKYDGFYKVSKAGDTPEDALASFAIELFRLGILKREDK